MFLDFLKHGDIFWISPARFFCGSENMFLAHDIGTQMGHKVPGNTEADRDGHGLASTVGCLHKRRHVWAICTTQESKFAAESTDAVLPFK